jgi:hypothetical protein
VIGRAQTPVLCRACGSQEAGEGVEQFLYRLEMRRQARRHVLDPTFDQACLEVRAGLKLNDEGAAVLQSVHHDPRIEGVARAVIT